VLLTSALAVRFWSPITNLFTTMLVFFVELPLPELFVELPFVELPLPELFVELSSAVLALFRASDTDLPLSIAFKRLFLKVEASVVSLILA